jgi:hypothetical protein
VTWKSPGPPESRAIPNLNTTSAHDSTDALIVSDDRPLTDDDLYPELDDSGPMTKAQARRVTEQIKLDMSGLWQGIKMAYVGRAWTALGYESWDDYCTHEFGTSRLRLPREERTEVVASLRESGLSIRAIASATGTGTRQVQEAIAEAQVCSQTTPDDDPLEVDAEIIDGPTPVADVIGVDGKKYPAAQPKPKPKPEPVGEEPVAIVRFPTWVHVHVFVDEIVERLDSQRFEDDYDLETPLTVDDLPTEKPQYCWEPGRFADRLRAALPRIHELIDLLDQVAVEDDEQSQS